MSRASSDCVSGGTSDRRVPARGLWGIVHDGNARFLGGAAGNAGLFGTVSGVAKLASAFLPASGFLSPASRELAWTPGRAPEGEARTAGWKRAASPGWTAGAALPPGAVGHEGFTGTSVWMEPEGEKVYILLTNRIHPRHPGTEFGAIRAEFLRRARTLAERA